MIKKIIIVIPILLFGIAIGIAYFSYRENTKELERQVIYLKNSNNLLKYSLLQSTIYGGDSINSILKTDKGIAPLSKIIDMNTLVLRFSDTSCSPCLKRELSNISDLEKRDIPILIIATYSNKREFQLLLKEYDIKSRYLLLDKSQYLFSFENASSDLYLFLLMDDLNFDYLFFPVQTEDSLSYDYYNFIEALYEKHRK